MISHYIPSLNEKDRNDAGLDINQVRLNQFNQMSFDDVKDNTFIKVRYRTSDDKKLVLQK